MIYIKSNSSAIRLILPMAFLAAGFLGGCASREAPQRMADGRDAVTSPQRRAHSTLAPAATAPASRPGFLNTIPPDMSLDELRTHAAVRPPVTVTAEQLPYSVANGQLGPGLNRLVVETSGMSVFLLAPAVDARTRNRYIIRPHSVHQGLAEFIIDLNVDAPTEGWSIQAGRD